MQTMKVSATHARNDFFNLLAMVAMGREIVVEKDKKPVARLGPIVTKVGRNKGLVRALDKASMNFVYDEKDNPLRRPGAADFLGKWDKQ